MASSADDASTDPFRRSAQAELARLDDQARVMTAALVSDFVDGRVGTRHQTFGHRARVLRQLDAQLASLRGHRDA